MALEIQREALRILDQSLLRAEPERLAFLDKACGDDFVLRNEVDSLLALREAAAELFDEPLLQLPRGEADGSTEVHPGDTLGSVEILQTIGSGGMGTVYLARHLDFGHEVAVKVLKPDRVHDEDIARFHQEQEILAQLDHPNVVRPLERGVTPDELPFLVMDYVKGVPIDQYCTGKKLPVERKLELFRKVCAIVHFAHQNLIVHRDLKPANILVTDEGEPKLLDFGIAGLLRPSPYTIDARVLRNKSALAFLGTLRYASPEQVRNGHVPRTASDVYALGVILYELLTGHRPYAEESSSFFELSQAICETDPDKPSTTVAKPGGVPNPDSVRVTRGGAPKKLERRLSGDLDAIVLKALEKNPDQRYSSAEQLSEDLRRHLEHFPVQAREATFAYRAEKFVKRHTFGITMSFLVFFMLFGFSMAMVWMWDRERQARKEQEKAFYVADYIVKLFEVDDLGTTEEGITAHQLLDDGVPILQQAKRMEELSPAQKSRIQDQLPEDLPGLMAAFGWAYYGLGSYAQADHWLTESRELLRTDLPDDDSVLVAFRLAAVRRAQEKEQEAFALESEAKALLASRGVASERLGHMLNELAFFLENRGDLLTTVATFDAAVDVLERVYGANAAVAIGLSNRASLLTKLGRYEEAEVEYRRSYEIRHEVYGSESEEVAILQNNLGVLLRDLGVLNVERKVQAWDEAAELFQSSLDTHIRLSGVDGVSIATTKSNLADLLRLRGDCQQAGLLYDDVLRIFQEIYGEADRTVGITLKNRALWQQACGNPSEAETTARRAVAMLQDLLGSDHWRTAEAEGVLGRCLLALGRGDEAEPLLRRSLAVIVAEQGTRGRVSFEARQALARLESERDEEPL